MIAFVLLNSQFRVHEITWTIIVSTIVTTICIITQNIEHNVMEQTYWLILYNIKQACSKYIL